MSFQLGNRDANGVLQGSFDQGRGAFPIDVLTDIVPFLYPCSECNSMVFHVVGEQHAGIGIKIPFARKPLVSTGKGYQAICNSCTNINTVLTRSTVDKLRGRIIPGEICDMYASVCDPPEPYSDGFLDHFIGRHTEASEQTVAFVARCLNSYRREKPPLSVAPRGSNDIESDLERQYAETFCAMGSSKTEALDNARSMLQQAKAVVKEMGLETERPNCGSWLLNQEATDQKISAVLAAARKEGVKDEDIRWWWNQSPLERVMLEKADELNRTAAFLSSLQQGMDGDEAAKRVWKIHPKFGNPADGCDDDRPLPIELKRRIVEFTERYYEKMEVMRHLTEQFNSFNALVRHELRAGRL